MLTVLAWVPLLVLSALQGHAWGGVTLPFLYDVELHARLLLAMPLLILAELAVHRRLRGTVEQFVERDLIPDRESCGIRRGPHLGDAAAQLGLGGGAAPRPGLRRRGRIPLAETDGPSAYPAGTAQSSTGYGGRRSPAGGWAW